MLSPTSTSPVSPGTYSTRNPLLPPVPPSSHPAAGPGAGMLKPKPKPRKRVNTAEKRSQHNAIERARRETLNSKFIVLARLLPSLADARRPSKSAIVNGSIKHLAYQREQRLLAARLLREVWGEREELIREVNQWRGMNGYPQKEARGVQGEWGEEMEEVLGVEKEAFGTFAGMGMEDGEEGEDEDIAGNGLITPRESIDKLPLAPWPAPEYYPMPNYPSSASLTSTLAPANGNGPFLSDTSASASASEQSPMTYHHPALTPPLSAVETQTMYSHTPSPASSHSQRSHSLSLSHHSQGQGEDVKPSTQQLGGHQSFPGVPGVQGGGVQGAQMMALQQQYFVNQSLHAQAQAHGHPPFHPSLYAHGHGHAQGQAQAQAPGGQGYESFLQGQGQGQGQDVFTQQLLASIFPSSGGMAAAAASQGQGGQVSMVDLQKAVRTGMELGFGMSGMGQWAEASNAANAGGSTSPSSSNGNTNATAVEGF
ncbi:hypothetical protein L198_06614 [Cryptococcus wingfieldii CBS 7118]|uniref:BHLH domain-containing protein n=1 Tax=Cryptococcus wingfieldii CBS 7118 TaxID=1295528 RepID=A0A1E3IJP1_9TREE|nr:hypothetical protein L198_06614 [Cryptococcus wingfieldii CBS 7118]ODN88812.1 hypothetical protein L198_06614 [Cryptococcus wingfieldii CBS 7118]